MRRRTLNASAALVFNNDDEAAVTTKVAAFPTIVEVTVRKSKMDHLTEVGLSWINALVYDKRSMKVDGGVTLQLVSTETDSGDPDKGMEHARPTLGGENNPHPRRCRTGRPPTKIDSNAESPVSAHVPMYVLRDEQFDESKKVALEMRQNKGRVRNVIPQLLFMISEENGDAFQGSYLDINSLYKQHLKSQGKPSLPLFKAFKISKDLLDDNFKFDPPKAIPKSALTEEHIISNLNGLPVQQVLTPPVDATTNWLWQLAKAHVCANDAGVHQLVNHWLRTHACIEPFIIAAHRQLSVMHPIYKLLDPHMKYTLQVNAMARETLINAGGIIENDFTPGKYSMLLPCAAYRDWWRFDLEALPSDLIRREVAISDPSQPYGLRLLIEDYRYANDGLLIWSAIEESSAQHAALNFGQYPYGGYIPTRPPLMRRLVPHQCYDPVEYKKFMANPQAYFFASLPSLAQATRFMAVVDILSAHSSDKEYLGERDLSTWSGDPEIVEAFYNFSMEMKRIERVIEERNGDVNLRNRCGAGVTPYELFVPSSGPGVTSKGVPNSITL
uniref:Lipoxygenase domain-containing protein n=1 Tax=Chenopodium quinoa TaxID=63459 RepID=A0A803LLH7_CHEQI